jgi:hydrogenase maturation protease
LSVMRTVILGIGNPILSDDAAGLKVAQMIEGTLKKKKNNINDIDVKQIYTGGLAVAEAMAGYDEAIIIDAIVTGNYPVGTVRELTLKDLPKARNITNTHDTDFSSAIELARSLSIKMPGRIRIFGLESGDVGSFGDSLSEDVGKAIGRAARKILAITGRHDTDRCDTDHGTGCHNSYRHDAGRYEAIKQEAT